MLEAESCQSLTSPGSDSLWSSVPQSPPWSLLQCVLPLTVIPSAVLLFPLPASPSFCCTFFPLPHPPPSALGPISASLVPASTLPSLFLRLVHLSSHRATVTSLPHQAPSFDPAAPQLLTQQRGANQQGSHLYHCTLSMFILVLYYMFLQEGRATAVLQGYVAEA